MRISRSFECSLFGLNLKRAVCELDAMDENRCAQACARIRLSRYGTRPGDESNLDLPLAIFVVLRKPGRVWAADRNNANGTRLAWALFLALMGVSHLRVLRGYRTV